MFSVILEAVASGLFIPGLSVTARSDAPGLKISIPRDHPKAGKLLQLAQFLASHVEYANGLRVERTCPVAPQDAEDALLDMLRAIVDPEEVDQTVARIKDWSRERRAEEFLTKQLRMLHTPTEAAAVIDAGLVAGREHFDPKSKELISNVADRLRARRR